jgi:hypothetical protein
VSSLLDMGKLVSSLLDMGKPATPLSLPCRYFTIQRGKSSTNDDEAQVVELAFM